MFSNTVCDLRNLEFKMSKDVSKVPVKKYKTDFYLTTLLFFRIETRSPFVLKEGYTRTRHTYLNVIGIKVNEKPSCIMLDV